MMDRDILLEEGDLAIKNNDLLLGDATDQNIYLVLVGTKGNFPRDRSIGMGLYNYLNTTTRRSKLLSDARRELKRAGYDVVLQITEKGLDWYEIQSKRRTDSN